jgi:hypothetical protein
VFGRSATFDRDAYRGALDLAKVVMRPLDLGGPNILLQAL